MAPAFEPLPTDVATVLDAAWLSEALDLVGDGDRIVDVQQVGSSRTVAEKVLFTVTVDGAGGRQVHPLCVKAHFADGLNSLRGEASFYRHMRPVLGVRAPRAYYTAVDDEAGRGLIVMDDIVSLGGRILEAQEPYSLETCRDTLDQLARLHAGTWGDERWDVDWLAPRVAAMATAYPTDALQTLLDDGRGDGVPRDLLDAARLQAAMLRFAERAPTCVVHGDTHSGNAYLDAEGRACWLDWQVVQRGHWSLDVSYHLGTVLSTEDRRAHERDLVAHYVEALAAHGAPPPSFDSAWESYTLGFTWGFFLWTITRISSRAVVLLHFPRLAAALDDHDTFNRLGV
jgi:aminoglycoside phosphotransferase (APT) family kinase protein